MSHNTSGPRLGVSAVVPAYNVAPYIAEALSSVFSQTLVPDETIVVDDGSTDELERAVGPFRDRISYVRQAHSGVSAARNRGISLARGEWVAFLDGDDSWCPYKIERQMQLAESGIGFIFCWKQEFNEADPSRGRTVSYERICCDRPLTAILTRFFASPSTVVARRDLLLDAGGFDETLLDGSEDADMWIRLADQTRFAQVEQPLVRSRLRASSLCGRQSRKEFTMQIIGPLLKHRDRLLAGTGMSPARFHLSIASSYLSFARKWLAMGDYGAAAWALQESGRELLKASSA